MHLIPDSSAKKTRDAPTNHINEWNKKQTFKRHHLIKTKYYD